MERDLKDRIPDIKPRGYVQKRPGSLFCGFPRVRTLRTSNPRRGLALPDQARGVT